MSESSGNPGSNPGKTYPKGYPTVDNNCVVFCFIVVFKPFSGRAFGASKQNFIPALKEAAKPEEHYYKSARRQTAITTCLQVVVVIVLDRRF